jgi:hypothetical protein
MNKEFSRLENLWVGEKKENQQKGSDAGAAEKALKKAKPGTPEYEAALAKRSAAMVDPAKGTANGQQVGVTEKTWINQISGANSRLPNIQNAHQNGNLKLNSPFYTVARNDRIQTELSQKGLGDFSKTMRSSEFPIINSSLISAAKIIYELNRMLPN